MNIYNYNHLFYFYVTAKLNGVTIAAKYLNTSQSSLSTQIKTLEAVLGKKLFKKLGRKIELTDFGKELFSYCRRAFEVFDEMFDHLNKRKSSMGIRIAVGVSMDIERPFVTDILTKASKQYSKDQRPLLNLTSLPSSQLLQSLKAGEIDFLLTTKAIIDNEFELLSEFDFPVGIFANKENAALIKTQDLDDVIRKNKLTFVLASRHTSLRTEIDRYFIKKKINPTCIFESNIMASVIRAACDGLGATILPQSYVSRELQSGKLVALDNKPMWKHRIILLSVRQRLENERREFAEKIAFQLNSIRLTDIK